MQTLHYVPLFRRSAPYDSRQERHISSAIAEFLFFIRREFCALHKCYALEPTSAADDPLLIVHYLHQMKIDIFAKIEMSAFGLSIQIEVEVLCLNFKRNVVVIFDYRH